MTEQEILWGAQTQRAIENFDVSGHTVDLRVVHALASIKAAAAETNGRSRSVKAVSAEVGRAIAAAAKSIAAGDHDDQFPVGVFQTGSGTSTNMNVNEVIANLTRRDDVHPNDQVNASQSTNDTFPSAMRIAAAMALTGELQPAMKALAGSLRRKEREFKTVVKAGRTHTMDATPVTLGQEFGGWASQIDDCRSRIDDALARLCRLPLGGTATGTGINAPPAFAAKTIARLADQTGLPLAEAPNHFALQGGQDDFADISGHLRTLAIALTKIGNDLRWLASGPAAGLAEIVLPELQPGSSIMPGKVNPVIVESVTQVAARVMGNDVTIGFACSQGTLELNTYLPIIANTLLESISLLGSSCQLLATLVVDGVVANEERCRTYAERSAAIATALAPYLGYERTADIVAESLATGRTIRDIVSRRRLIPAAQLDSALDVLAMTRGGVRS